MKHILNIHLSESHSRIKSLINQPFTKIIFYATFILNILGVVAIGLVFVHLPPQIPLYYSRPWGEDQITTPIFLFILPLGSLLFHCTSIFLIITQTYRYRVYAQLLLTFSLVVAILASFTIYNIIRLVL